MCGNRLMYTPKFQITSKILSNVGTIDAAREVITHAPLVPAWERRFQEDARVRIVHHGTHLEGNELNLEEVERIVERPRDIPGMPNTTPTPLPAKDRDIQEVINYRTVMEYIDTLTPNTQNIPGMKDSHTPGMLVSLTENTLKEIHRQTVARILPESEAGRYRSAKVVIRNTATGEITFRPPPPIEVPYHMSEFFAWLVSDEGRSVHPLIRAGIVHYELVRIHPFTDGNGRATRAFALLLLFLEGYEVKRFFSLEEYYDAHPDEYYGALQSVTTSGGDLTWWLEYFTLGIAIELNRVKELVQKLSLDLHLKVTMGGKQIALSDRQIRLVEYLEKHAELGMKDARDLMPQVSDDTVLRDLRDLVDKGLIHRKGNTKGAKYYLKS